MVQAKPIPIGIEFYKEMIDNGYYYIDKTLLIRDILAQKNKVTLFTRPRRFGKTLAQSMLQAYFEKEILPREKDYGGRRGIYKPYGAIPCDIPVPEIGKTAILQSGL